MYKNLRYELFTYVCIFFGLLHIDLKSSIYTEFIGLWPYCPEHQVGHEDYASHKQRELQIANTSANIVVCRFLSCSIGQCDKTVLTDIWISSIFVKISVSDSQNFEIEQLILYVLAIFKTLVVCLWINTNCGYLWSYEVENNGFYL